MVAGFQGGPEMGVRSRTLSRRGLVEKGSKQFRLGKGSRAWTFRITPPQGEEYLIKYFTKRAFGYADVERTPKELRDKWFALDEFGYHVLEHVLPATQGETDSFSALKILAADRHRYFIKLSDAKGQVLSEVVGRLGEEHPTSLELSRLYRRRLENFQAALAQEAEATKIQWLGENPLFPELAFLFGNIWLVVCPEGTLVDTDSHVMTIFDPT